jgi:hypothetical protein
LCSWLWGPTITLQDCLAAFFSEDELKGDNMYSCEKCKKWVTITLFIKDFYYHYLCLLQVEEWKEIFQSLAAPRG